MIITTPMIIALLIFLFTLIIVIWQPRGLSVGWSASIGAILALLFGIVSLSDIVTVTHIVWNATFAFIAAMLISLVMDEIGFFEWAALHMARFAKGNGHLMFIYTILLGSVITAFFNNDGAILIMTPILLAMTKALGFDNKMIFAFVFAGGFIADTTSLPLVISNLVNILSADYFQIGFLSYAIHMIIPNIFALIASLICLYLFFRKDIPKTYNWMELQKPSDAIRDHRLFKLSWVMLIILFAGYFVSELLHIPVSIIASGAAFIFLVAASNNPKIKVKKIIIEAPWTVIIFSIGMYLVVFSLHNVGFTQPLTQVIKASTDHGLLYVTFVMGFSSAFLSSLMNNLPTVMFDSLVIQATQTTGMIRDSLIYANIIGADLGPKMTPLGSLATLLWIHVLARKKITISWIQYCKVGIILTIPTLIITLFGLYLWFHILY
ncbi:arsenite efflux membrane protein ArsB [Seinonella peptonophila]|uniref:Arsenical pump membrane protein n=2 Tax=Seinonella peptonophila TaxID=112248 RepID=A0A1M5BCC6_9BACL|nr:arsenite efflux membrane protein ArsB [Seinonella peptonophila]